MAGRNTARRRRDNCGIRALLPFGVLPADVTASEKDTVRVVTVDLDIDSDNTNGYEEPDRSVEEELFKDN